MTTLDFEHELLFDYEFEKLAKFIQLLRKEIPDFEFLESRLIMPDDSIYDALYCKNNQQLKNLILNKSFLILSKYNI